MAGSHFSYIDSGIGLHFTLESLSNLIQFGCPLCSGIRSDPDYFRAYLLRIEV